MNIKKHVVIFLLFTISVCLISVATSFPGEFLINSFLGINTEEDALLIPDGSSPDMVNCDPSGDGLSLSTRDGIEYAFSITYSTNVIKQFGLFKTNTYNYLMVASGVSLEAIERSGSGYTNTTVATSTNSTTSLYWDFAQHIYNLLIVNGNDPLLVYSGGVTSTTVASAPIAKSIAVYNNTIFLGNLQGQSSYVQISAYGDYTDWTTGVLPAEGDKFSIAAYGADIVDLESFADGVMVLCSHSLHKIIGTQNPYQVIEIDSELGCRSKGSVISRSGVIYFLGSDGQYYSYDNASLTCISAGSYFSAFDATALSQSTSTVTTDSCAIFSDDRLYYGCMVSSSSTSGDAIFVYDPSLQYDTQEGGYTDSWWKYTGIYPADMIRWDNEYFVGSSTSGCVYKMFEGTSDNGVNIDAYFYSKMILSGNLLQQSSFDAMAVMFATQDSGTFNIEYFLNSSTTAVNSVSINNVDTNSISVKKFKFPEEANGNVIQFKISNVSGSVFKIYTIFGASKEFPLLYQKVK